MIRKKSFDLAMEYFDTNLWKEISDCDMFAVRLPEDRIGYCIVMGMMGNHILKPLILSASANFRIGFQQAAVWAGILSVCVQIAQRNTITAPRKYQRCIVRS